MSTQSVNLYRGSMRQVMYWAQRALAKGLIPVIQGPPAIGKSAGIRALADRMKLELIDDRVATNGPEHYTGLPDVSGDKAVYKPFEVFPLEGDPLPAGKEGWLFFLDEFNSGLPSTMVGMYKFLQEREVGQKKLHPNVFIMAAGNRDEDRAITNALGTAIQSRLIWLEVELDGTNKRQFDEFMMDVAIPQKWDNRVVAYLNWKPDALNDFDAEHTQKTFSAPRTLDFLSRLIQGEEVTQEDTPLYVGAIGDLRGAEFATFSEVFGKLPTLQEILDDPRLARVPTDMPEQWATIAMLIDATTPTNLEDLGNYVENFGLEFKILYWRSLQHQQPNLRREPAFRRAQTSLTRYLYTDE